MVFTCKLITCLNYKTNYLNMSLLSKVFVSGQCKSWLTDYAQLYQSALVETNPTNNLSNDIFMAVDM